MAKADPILETERLRLRPWRDDDLDALAALNTDPEVMRYFPSCLDRAGTAAMMARNRDHVRRHGYGWWAVEIPGVTPFAGGAALLRPRFHAHFTPCHEIGWRLAKARWGQGFGTEAAKAVVTFAFDQIGLDELVAFTAAANEPSISVMRRLGMTHRSTDDFGHPLLPFDHPLRPHRLLRLRAND